MSPLGLTHLQMIKMPITGVLIIIFLLKCSFRYNCSLITAVKKMMYMYLFGSGFFFYKKLPKTIDTFSEMGSSMEETKSHTKT